MEIVNLSDTGLSQGECRKAASWMAQAFARAPATPALTIFFGAAPYESNIEMHEKFWSSHLNRVAKSGFLIGARENGEWLGFRAFFEPGKSRLPYVTDYVGLVLVMEWGEKTSRTNEEVGLTPGDCYTTSIIVVNPARQRQGIGRALDNYTQTVAREAKRSLHSALNYIVANHPENPAPVLVGHSLGGGALQFMLAHRLLRIGDESANGQIPGLILLGSVPIYGGGPEIIGNIKEVEAPNGYPHIWSDRGLVSTPKQVRQLFFTEYAEEDTIHEWMDMCKTELESAMAGLYICFPLGDASNVLRGLAGVGTPMHTRKVLCVAGVEDKLVPPAMVLSNSGIYANAATKLKMDPDTCMVVTVNNCAHHLMMDAGWEYCALAMRKWLEGQEL
ncbi:hypothetical protein E8E14_008553 [Neopestalotiopsis sp. 37M]|nr:hypothetical protein E8E14_008553 [Neopestalotiopsis sp. 37M]